MCKSRGGRIVLAHVCGRGRQKNVDARRHTPEVSVAVAGGGNLLHHHNNKTTTSQYVFYTTAVAHRYRTYMSMFPLYSQLASFFLPCGVSEKINVPLRAHLSQAKKLPALQYSLQQYSAKSSCTIQYSIIILCILLVTNQFSLLQFRLGTPRAGEARETRIMRMIMSMYLKYIEVV